jgi:hypothetical protein
MATTIFFSWQSDRPTSECRNFVERALDIAAKNVLKDFKLESALRDGLEIDKDTRKVPGSPKIFETILQKIEKATVFVPDFTFVAERPNGDPTPNPNVLIEYGYARKCKEFCQLMPVMNVAYGEPNRKTMPFDLIEHRNPIKYNLPASADEETRRKVREELAKEFESALRTFFESDDYRQLTARPEGVSYREPKDGRARFREEGKPIGISRDYAMAGLTGGDEVSIYLNDAPAMWLRVMPETPIEKPFRIVDIGSRVRGLITLPFMEGYGDLLQVRDEDGLGYCRVRDQKYALFVTYVFTDGEIWSIDAWHLRCMPKLIPLDGKKYADSLAQCAQFLNDHLNVSGPCRWVAGIENAKGRYLTPPDKIVDRTSGPCGSELIEENGKFAIGDNPADSLEPFFEKLYDQCNIKRPLPAKRSQ